MVKRTARLQGSKQKKDDEYYTLFQDIADEVSLYLPQLRGKRILCPCDWDESYNEEIVYKEEGYVLGRDLFASEGTIKNIDIAKTREKIEKRMDLVKCQFVYYLLNQAEEWGIREHQINSDALYSLWGQDLTACPPVSKEKRRKLLFFNLNPL